MTDSCDCGCGTDPHALARAGVDRVGRAPAILDPAAVPVDERRTEHAMVFAAAFAEHLRYFGLDDEPDGDWRGFFDSSQAALVAAAAIGDVDGYRAMLNERFRRLENPRPSSSGTGDERMATDLRDVFDGIGTLVERLDTLHEKLPRDHALRNVIANLIRGQLAPMLQRLIGCYRAGETLKLIDRKEPPSPGIVVFGRPAASFSRLLEVGDRWGEWSTEWPAAVGDDTWGQFTDVDPAPYERLYGNPTGSTSARINHLAAHNLFRAATDAFLAAFARVVDAASTSLASSLSGGTTEPHYSLFLAFLRMLQHGREAVNGFTADHLDFYYGEVLKLSERAAEPSHAHVLVQLAKHISQHAIVEGTLIKAGKDDAGADAHFRVDRRLIANEAVVEQIARVFRNPRAEPVDTDLDRLYADIVPSDAPPWHPFAEKRYHEGAVAEIAMEPARVGLAIASHCLWMAEGDRTVTVRFALASGSQAPKAWPGLTCLLTTEKELLEVDGAYGLSDGVPELTIELKGDDPAIAPYNPAVHGYGFDTGLPVLVVLAGHDADAAWDYGSLDDIEITGIRIDVDVKGVRTLQLSNDQGPVDASKPFLAFGSAPRAGSFLVVGSNEIFQKPSTHVTVTAHLPVWPAAHPGRDFPSMSLRHLVKGRWEAPTDKKAAVTRNSASGTVVCEFDAPAPAFEVPDLKPAEAYSTASTSGFVRVQLNAGFGTELYPLALAEWAVARPRDANLNLKPPPPPPILPTVDSLSVDYTATHQLALDEPSEGSGRFFHITPFGHVERTLAGDAAIPLVPQFLTGIGPSEGELYLGIAALHPPQDLSLLFQVVDGTADPRAKKPTDHIAWSYLRGDEWAVLDEKHVADATSGLLSSGIVTFSVPDDATTQHTLLPAGLHWLRLSVDSGTDAVCRLAAVRAQGLRATATGDPGARGSSILPAGTLAKLDRPDAAVKGIEQPYPTFGGRPRETEEAFRTRVSERLRHKDRAIALWDYEHLILERFPSVYQARCLNHTEYEPNADGSGAYRELAPGHVTVVTIPDLAVPDQRDPLRPFTGLIVLEEIEQFLSERMNCFARLHVGNPQFEEVRVDLRVRLREGADERFHLDLLGREITEFLSPWAFRGGARPSFNGRIRKSVVIDFVEERPYVDYVTDVELLRLLPGRTESFEEVTGSRAISILVSVAADKHGILPIHEHSPETAPVDCGCKKAVKK